MRTILDLPDDQVERLAEVCRRDGISRAEAVRRAVSDYLDAQRAPERDDALGIWRDRQLDGLDYQREVRREWS